jgi:regulator of PEP synthase PpsR (kinase-PPPase family)
MERGHPVRQWAKPAQLLLEESFGVFALRAQADRMSAIRHHRSCDL